MSPEEFAKILEKIDGQVENVFLHLMGEPLLHPRLSEILDIADKFDISVKITTNGTLLHKALPILVKSKNLKTVSISLHSFEANELIGEVSSFHEYLSLCIESAKRLAEADKFAVLRLWNLTDDDTASSSNKDVLEALHHAFPSEWTQTHRGSRLAYHVFLEWGERFAWPDPIAEEKKETESLPSDEKKPFCHGLSSQIGILCDGRVVPCCLDRNGDINLGNIFESSLSEILSSERATALIHDLQTRLYREPLCKSCEFSKRREHSGA